MEADFIVITIGWSDEQIEGWKIMLERNVSFLTIVIYFILWGQRCAQFISRKKTRSFRNMNLLVISHFKALLTVLLLPVVAGEVGVGEEGGVGVVGTDNRDKDRDGAEDLVGVRGSVRGKIKTKLVGGTIIGREGMIRRWLGLGVHL
jgi:hypothetical protein